MPQQPAFDPIAAYRQAYANDSRTDAEIANKLRDPANFKKAFPDYDYSTPDAESRIKNHMESFYNTRFGAAPQTQSAGAASASPAMTATPQARVPMPPKESFQATDLIPNWAMPGLKKAGDFLNTPISKQLGLGSLSEQAEKTSPAPVQGGAAGAAKDAYTIANKAAGGVGDFIQTPAGIAAVGLEALTGGAATPWLAGLYTASAAPSAKESYEAYKAKPTPENLQKALVDAGQFVGMAAAGGKGVESHYAPKTPSIDPQTMNGRGAYEAPTPGSAGEPMQTPTRENVSNLHAKGYTNQEISNMDAQAFHDAVTGNAPVRPQAPTAAPRAIQDVIAPTPKGQESVASQATQGANYRPQYTYKPSEKTEVLSAKDIDRGPEFNAQSFQEEINRNSAILRHPEATVSDRAIAADRLRDAREGLTRVQSGGTVVPTTPGEVKDLSTQLGETVPQSRVQSLQAQQANRNAPESIQAADSKDRSQVTSTLQSAPVVSTTSPLDTTNASSGLSQSKTESLQATEQRASTAVPVSPDAGRQARIDAAKAKLASLESTGQTARSNEASYKQMVEDAGGRFVGVQSTGMVEYKIDPALVGGRTDVSVTSMASKMSPEFVKSEINRKVGEFADHSVPSNGPLVSAGEPVIKSETPVLNNTHAVMNRIFKSMTDMSKLKVKIDSETDPQKKAIHEQDLANTTARAKQAIKYHLSQLDEAGLNTLHDELEKQQNALDAQADAIREMVDLDKKAKPIVKEMRDRMRSGGPVKRHTVPDPETGEEVTIQGKQAAEVKRGMRDLFHELVGEKPFTRPEQLVVKDPPKGTTPEEWEQFIAGLQETRMQLRQEIARDFEILRDTGGSVEDSDLVQKMENLAETEEMIGSYPEAEQISARPKNPRTGEVIKEGWTPRKGTAVGRKPMAPVVLGEQGEIINKEVLPVITLAKAQAIMGTKVNKIPSHDEIEARADQVSEHARLHGAVASAVKKVLKARVPKGRETEAGAVGEINHYTSGGSVLEKPYNEEAVRPENVIAAVRAAGYPVQEVTESSASGRSGWLTPDGKFFIDKGSLTHSDMADIMLPDIREQYSPMRALAEEGWIRKESRAHYEAQRLGARQMDGIERDVMYGGMTGKPLQIDTRGPNGPMALDIEAGWTDLDKAISQAKREKMRQRGSATAMGLAQMATASLGGFFGYTVAGLPGGVLGFMAGAAAPTLLSSAPVKRAMRGIAPLVKAVNGNLRSWFQGVPQIDVATPRMKQVMTDQAIHGNRETSWIEKASRLPAQIAQGFDQFAMVADRDNQTGMAKILLAYDPRGKVFRDLSIPDTQSLYTALRSARGDAMGGRGANGIQYAKIRSEANQAGLRQALDMFLNLKGYQRVHDNLREHVQDLQSQIQNIQSKLQSPSNTPRQTDALNADMREAQTMINEITSKLQSGEATPYGYTQQEINKDIAALQNKLTPPQVQQLQAMAKRTFAVRANVLDLLHGTGIISDEAYQTYQARGPEYVPMERIVDDLEQSAFHSATNPMHLRHQTVIREMEGSKRTNVDPWEAFAHADARAFSQIFRNEVMNTALDLAKQYPQTIGREFNQVSQDYRAKKGEMIVGVYEQGQPKLFAVPEYLGQSLVQLPIAAKSALGALNGWAATAFKSAATVAVAAFQVTSLLTHAMNSAVVARGSGLRANYKLPVEAAKFVRDWGRAAAHVLQQSPEYIEMVRSGASFGTLRDFVDPEYNADPKSLGWTGKFKKGQYLDAAHEFASAAEDINRMNTFSRARQAGMTVREASIEARQRGGAPDFSRGGDMGRSLNMAFMFLNAALQYMNQASMAVRKDPKRVGGLMVLALTLSLGLSAWNNTIVDDKGVPMIRKENSYERERNFIILTPWSYPTSTGATKAINLKIPKPAVFRYLNPIEALYNRYFGVEGDTGRQQALNAIASVSPIRLNLKAHKEGSSLATSVVSDLHPIAKFGIQQYSNTDDFGNPIVPLSQQSGPHAILPEYQSSVNSSPTAQVMGQGGLRGAAAGATLGGGMGLAISGLRGAGIGGTIGAAAGAAGVSPRRIDVGLNSLTAGMGRFATGILDPFMPARLQPDQRDMQGPEAARNLPVVGGLVSRFTTSAPDAEERRITEEFYNDVDTYGRISNTAKMLAKQDPAEYQRFSNKYKDDLFRGLLAEQLAKKVGMISAQIKNIENNPQYTPQARQQMIRSLTDAKKQLMKALQAPGTIGTQGAKR